MKNKIRKKKNEQQQDGVRNGNSCNRAEYNNCLVFLKGEKGVHDLVGLFLSFRGGIRYEVTLWP